MITVNSLSGGKTSSYLAVHYPADHNIFALVRTNDKNCLFPDSKIRQIVSDKIGTEFIGTLEQDTIIYTMLDLEQFIGREITWLTGKTFDEIINRNGKKYLPNVTQRFCTVEMKLEPINKWWWDNIRETVEMRIGFRANESVRAFKMLDRCDSNGIMPQKFIVGEHPSGRKKWKNFPMRKPVFPLIDKPIFKDQIEQFWKDKPVRFAWMNNCVGCFHRNEILLNKMCQVEPKKMQWFIDQENPSKSYGKRTFKNGITYEKIKNYQLQLELFEDDFSDCDSGYCGL
jgi:hypothetical protein